MRTSGDSYARPRTGPARRWRSSTRCTGGGAYRAAYLVVHDAAAAEDIAQDAFLAAVDALDRFDRRRPFAPWLHRIVVNRALDWARREACAAGSTAPTRSSSRCRRPRRSAAR